MSKSDNQKLKILYIQEYLRRHSSEQKPVTAAELSRMLAERGIQAERKSIYSDLEALKDYGEDIICVPGRSGGYFIGSRNFQPSELKLLIDAVKSSRYLTERKSRELIEKLCRECSETDAGLLKRDVFVAGRVKTMNETIYYNVDNIQEAIGLNRQISFRYFDWGLDGERVYREKSYSASPYGLCQDSENCYLLALSPRHGITHYRVDRMAQIALLEALREPCPELTGKALNDYAGRLFNMFSGETLDVKLRFRRRLINVAVDRFGRDILMIPDGDDWFVFTAKVAVSDQFLSWVFGFGGDAKILYPAPVVQAFRDHCRKVLAQYGE